MPLPDTSVKFFSSTMAGAPALSGTAGTLIAVLDACLVSGFGSVTLDSLTVTDDVATAVVSAGHGFAMIGGVVGSVIQIDGATPAALNGQWRIATVPNTTTFTFATSGIANGAATGTITAKRAASGWEKRYSGTNKAAYARLGPLSTAMLLRIDDTGTTSAGAWMYESMTGVDTGSGVAPTSDSVYVGKSATANSTARAWNVFVDEQTLYLFINSNTVWEAGFCFGDLMSYKSPDAFCAYLCGGASYNWGLFLSDLNSNIDASWISRAFAQTGPAIQAARYSHRRSEYAGYAAQAAPNPVSNAYHFWPIEVWETTVRARGVLPGCFSPVHTSCPVTGSVVAANGRAFMFQQSWDSARRFALDLTGPWR